ncbi:MAG: S9 family peptidase [Candidatus Palauibacterales bacterium]|nr:S9 family peptidase [Candidatus Palauibacterales bacterium]MDP2584810.1 S9 family peptidase [Candidatus Palauibacterales bacterium]
MTHLRRACTGMALCAVAATGCAKGSAGESGATQLTLQTLFSSGRGVTSARLSPDGTGAAIEARGPRGPGVYLVDVGEGKAAAPRFLAGGRQAAWAPGGDRVAFVSGSRLWVVAADGGEPSAVTDSMPGVRSPAFSPDGSTLAFYSTASGSQDIWLAKLEGGAPRQLTRKAMSEDDPRFTPSWSPDGGTIAYVSNQADYWSDDVWLVDISSGKTRQLSHALMASSTPVWSPDGREVALMGTAKNEYWYQDLAYLYVLDPSGGGERTVDMQVWASDDEFHNDIFWSGDGSRIYFPYMQRGDYDLWSVPAAGGVATRVTNVGGAMRSFDASEGASLLSFVRSTPDSGSELYVVPQVGGTPRRVTHESPRFSDLVEPREVSFRSWDGLYIQGFLYLPPGVQKGEACPALVQVHGGGTNSYLHGENLIEQYLAQQGFVVLAINYRGGSGFGRKFQDLAIEDWLNGQAKDPGAAADYLRTLSFVNGKVGIYGGSYGGMQSMAAITRTPGKFDAAVPMRGIYSEALTYPYQDRLGKIFTKTGHGGLPDQRPDIYEKTNTLDRFDRIQTPLLIMHGEADHRAPFENYKLAVEKLKQLGKPFEAHSYPGEGHGFHKIEDYVDMYGRLTKFFEEHLGRCAATS